MSAKRGTKSREGAPISAESTPHSITLLYNSQSQLQVSPFKEILADGVDKVALNPRYLAFVGGATTLESIFVDEETSKIVLNSARGVPVRHLPALIRTEAYSDGREIVTDVMCLGDLTPFDDLDLLL